MPGYTVSYRERVLGFTMIFVERIAGAVRRPWARRSCRVLTILGPDPSGSPGQLDDFLKYHGVRTESRSSSISVDELRRLDVLVDENHGGQLFQIFVR